MHYLRRGGVHVQFNTAAASNSTHTAGAAISSGCDVPLHDLLQKRPDHPTLERAEREPQNSLTLPSPVFPQHPALFHELDAADIAAHDTVLRTGKRHWPASKVLKTMKGWMFPYFKSRVLPGDFQPIIAAVNR